MMNRLFWASIANDSLTFDERLEILQTCEFNIHEEAQPWCILQYFSDITDTNDALKVAEIFKKRFGLLIIEKEITHYNRKFTTIMDEFESEYCSSDDVSFWVDAFRNAFKATGFLYAKDVNPRELYAMYLDRYYYEFDGIPFVEAIEPWPLTEHLAQYLFHPDRVSKWMEANPDKGVEEYLN